MKTLFSRLAGIQPTIGERHGETGGHFSKREMLVAAAEMDRQALSILVDHDHLGRADVDFVGHFQTFHRIMHGPPELADIAHQRRHPLNAIGLLRTDR